MGDTGPVEASHLFPHLSQKVVRDLLGGGVLERFDVWLPRDDECVARRAERRRDHLGNTDTCLGRHERRQRFVLDLLQTPIRDASGWIAVGKRPPASRQPLGVLCIPPEHADFQRASPSLGANVLRRPDVLAGRRSQVRCLDTEGCQSLADVGGQRHAGRRTECESHHGARAKTEGKGRKCARGSSRAEHDSAEQSERDEPDREYAHRPDEFGAHDDEHRYCPCQPQLGEAPAGQRMRLDREPIGLDCPTENGRHGHDPDARRQQVAREVPASAYEHGDDDHDSKPENAEEGCEPYRLRPAEEGRQRLLNIHVVPCRRRRDHRRKTDDDCSNN